MTPETNPYDAAIADLEARIRSMQITLETLKQLRGGDGTSFSAPSAAARLGDSEVQHDSFFGMTIADAAKKYLAMMKTTKSTADIAAGLEQGGLKHSSKDFSTTVRSILGSREDFLRVPNGDWGLSEWYPGKGRGKKAKAEKPIKAKTRTARKAKVGRSKIGKPKLEDQIVTAMKAEPDKDWTSVEVATALEAQRTSVQSIMSRMGKEGKRIIKAERGYRLVKLLIGAA
jgi:hypothetical protein